MTLVSPRATALIWQGNTVLLLWRRRGTQEYFVFPGGRIEPDETAEQAVRREILEETSVHVDQLVFLGAHEDENQRIHQVFSCRYQSGVPHLSLTSEEQTRQGPENQYVLQWIDKSQLLKLPIYPNSLRDWLGTSPIGAVSDHPRWGAETS